MYIVKHKMLFYSSRICSATKREEEGNSKPLSFALFPLQPRPQAFVPFAHTFSACSSVSRLLARLPLTRVWCVNDRRVHERGPLKLHRRQVAS